MKKNILLLFLGLLGFSCIQEDYFGPSSFGLIKNIVVSNQATTAVIDSDSLLIIVEIHGGVDLSNITIETLQVSSFATSDKTEGDILDLQNDGKVTVIAEDGTEYPWTIRATVASETPQLSNGDLNAWYLTANNFYEPGEDAASTIWGTGNPGTQIMNMLATVPEDLGNNNLAAKMETLDLGFLAGTFGVPIAAGSIFTGYFNSDNIEITDPEAAIEFGTLFSGRPTKIRFKYSYVPGEENKNRDGDLLDYGDACDIYAFLEIRQGGTVERLATAWFRSEELQQELATHEITFTYGTLDNTFPDYMFPVEENFVSDELATYGLPTHLTFVASSSFDGANFSGAVGSTLIIDDIELIYE